jgi:hypothetical protein
MLLKLAGPRGCSDGLEKLWNDIYSLRSYELLHESFRRLILTFNSRTCPLLLLLDKYLVLLSLLLRVNSD